MSALERVYDLQDVDDEVDYLDVHAHPTRLEPIAFIRWHGMDPISPEDGKTVSEALAEGRMWQGSPCYLRKRIGVFLNEGVIWDPAWGELTS
ncbi:hypothetical protein ACEUZ9_000239 [Paracoccus litorisediminis]|uniref:Uncharacterized protein n=1 Tax=Paracoccus litorisediminis TaxID=2006130 RepID=A0A844HE55_9RHOB|nr:hypothetical protein [Paracoccus litorisediminis]MTH57613.1 hypothetical protein [Paracoccus litorisediminis]